MQLVAAALQRGAQVADRRCGQGGRVLVQGGERLEQHVGVAHPRQPPSGVAQRGRLRALDVAAQVGAREAHGSARLLQALAGVVHGRVAVGRAAPLEAVDRIGELLVEDPPDAGGDAFVLVETEAHPRSLSRAPRRPRRRWG